MGMYLKRKCIPEEARDGKKQTNILYITRQLSREESAYKCAWRLEKQEKRAVVMRNYTPASCLPLLPNSLYKKLEEVIKEASDRE